MYAIAVYNFPAYGGGSGRGSDGGGEREGVLADAAARIKEISRHIPKRASE